LSPLDFIITGMPRSGTGYASKVLSRVGLACGHEKLFSHNKQTFEVGSTGIGDSSWLAAPFLTEMSEATVTFYQTRDPYKILDSNLPPKGRLVGDARRKGPYARFARHHLGNPPDINVEDERERMLYWFVQWDALCRRHCNFEYPVEDMGNDLLSGIHLNITGVAPSSDKLTEALGVATDTNHRNKVTPWSEEYCSTHTGTLVDAVQDIAAGRHHTLRRLETT
jgi:hypothetical protein